MLDRYILRKHDLEDDDDIAQFFVATPKVFSALCYASYKGRMSSNLEAVQ